DATGVEGRGHRSDGGGSIAEGVFTAGFRAAGAGNSSFIPGTIRTLSAAGGARDGMDAPAASVAPVHGETWGAGGDVEATVGGAAHVLGGRDRAASDDDGGGNPKSEIRMTNQAAARKPEIRNPNDES